MIKRFCDICGNEANERLFPVIEPIEKESEIYIDIRACIKKSTSPREGDLLADMCNSCLASYLVKIADGLEF